jgi:hypothetical protein
MMMKNNKPRRKKKKPKVQEKLKLISVSHPMMII